MNRAGPILLALHAMTSLAFPAPVRVACLGDSITFGDRLPERSAQSYPAVLSRLAQGSLVTGNFGVNGATALDIPFRAWSGTPACQDALSFKPDLVVVMLGINDLAFPDRYAQYPAALRDLVVRFQSLPSSPRVFLCTLTPIAPAEQQTQANRAIQDVMIPAIRAVAAETAAQLIDLHAVFPNRLDLLPDGLHPSPEGAELIARTILAAIEAPALPPPRIRPAPTAGPVDLSIRNEAIAAKARAERWLGGRPPPADLPDPRAQWKDRALRAPEDVAAWLPMLSSDSAGSSADPYLDYAALAGALAQIGQETVFLSADRPVAWREALLHQLVRRQRIDATGGGFWSNPAAADPDADALRSTTLAVQALATALGGE